MIGDKQKVIYLTYGSMSECSVFRTQILDLLQDLRHEGINTELFILVSIRRFFDVNIKKDKKYLNKNGFKNHFYIYMSAHYYISVLLAAASLFFKLFGSIIKKKRIIVHCREEIPSMVAGVFKKFYKNTEIICDIRGATLAEYIYETKKKGTYKDDDRMIRFFSDLEKLSLVESDKFLCVSNKMREHILSKHQIDSNKMAVIPCCASLDKFYFDSGERAKLRNILGVGNKIVFIYAGSLYGWQMFDKIVEIFNLLYKKIDQVFLVVCTGEKNYEILDTLPNGSYMVTHAKNEDMYKYYSAADYGIILREDSIVNIVSSPVKIAEYVACQLPFIATDCIGDAKNIIGSKSKECIFFNPLASSAEFAERIFNIISGSGYKKIRLDPELRKQYDRKNYMYIYKKFYFG